MIHFFAVFAIVQAIAWSPIASRFYRQWRERGNPISLAICAHVLFAAYIGGVPYWMLSSSNRSWACWVLAGLDLVVCAFFYGSFFQVRDKFKDVRAATANVRTTNVQTTKGSSS